MAAVAAAEEENDHEAAASAVAAVEPVLSSGTFIIQPDPNPEIRLPPRKIVNHSCQS